MSREQIDRFVSYLEESSRSDATSTDLYEKYLPYAVGARVESSWSSTGELSWAGPTIRFGARG